MQLLSKAQTLPSEPQKCTRGQVCAQSRSSMCTRSGRTEASTSQVPARLSFLASKKATDKDLRNKSCLPSLQPKASQPQLRPSLSSCSGLPGLGFQPSSSYCGVCWSLPRGLLVPTARVAGGASASCFPAFHSALPGSSFKGSASVQELCWSPRNRRSISHPPPHLRAQVGDADRFQKGRSATQRLSSIEVRSLGSGAGLPGFGGALAKRR